MKQTITLKLRGNLDFPVEADVIDGGEWAVHEKILDPIGHHTPGCYAITSVSTGLCVAFCDHHATALRIARLIRALMDEYGYAPSMFVHFDWKTLTPAERTLMRAFLGTFQNALRDLGGLPPVSPLV